MGKWLKGGVFAAGFLLLLFFIQYQFVSTDSGSVWSLPLSGKIIIVDAGHGGIDGGASSKEGLLEKDVSLEISLILRDYLQEAGALVIMSRVEDTDLADPATKGVRKRKVQDLKRRVQLVNESDGDMFVSLHLNAIPSPRWSGAQTFYNRAVDENEKVAKFIQEEIRTNLENTSRLAKPIGSVYLLKHAQIPGALVEVGFLSNPEEARLLTTEEYQQKIAASIYQGIMRYYTNEPVPSS
ncbi:N-acetylmuramoyl-L-alanine amidase CwlD [Anaerobacillus isosaccharinicus]|uniref:N-acetylmuramoyl-L-alanine amidase CwlD n=1 Tax=Anaerobacillus isosaccharinicus TaxID=1532552 RepID=A0A1S2MDD1_9BACI|nr:N-acetylmuramoyl-L-alanine amidase CwlD [Anaerobacillus isosaccharinicus]MBA5584017.1 N-acetylmuramoyl-L-alanine amidase CwlD [Anaerobacillus isosaccharinicus]QOY37568.1 N-acetylmuramoyl-L-alanine amidase CwlD [Anaerobacillus isosaccharinicus]